MSEYPLVTAVEITGRPRKASDGWEIPTVFIRADGSRAIYALFGRRKKDCEPNARQYHQWAIDGRLRAQFVNGEVRDTVSR